MMKNKKKSLLKNNQSENQDAAGEVTGRQGTAPALQHKEKKAKDKNGKRTSPDKWDVPGPPSQQLEEAIG